MRKSKDRVFYESQHTSAELLRYYEGQYAVRNEIMLQQILPLLPRKSRVLDLAAGSSYLAEKLLLDERVERYVWNDFNTKLHHLVRSRISDERFAIDPFDADDEEQDLGEFNVFICVSLEHIERDLEILERLPRGCLVSICSPNLKDPSHVRRFKAREEMEERYGEVVRFKVADTYIRTHTKFIMTGFRR